MFNLQKNVDKKDRTYGYKFNVHLCKYKVCVRDVVFTDKNNLF